MPCVLSYIQWGYFQARLEIHPPPLPPHFKIWNKPTVQSDYLNQFRRMNTHSKSRANSNPSSNRKIVWAKPLKGGSCAESCGGCCSQFRSSFFQHSSAEINEMTSEHVQDCHTCVHLLHRHKVSLFDCTAHHNVLFWTPKRHKYSREQGGSTGVTWQHLCSYFMRGQDCYSARRRLWTNQ